MSPAPVNSSHVGLIAGAIALLIVGGIVGYVMGKSGSKPVVTTTPMTTIPTSASTSSPVASNWKTYVSAYGFEFQYPENVDIISGKTFSVNYMNTISGDVANNYYTGYDRAVITEVLLVDGQKANRFYNSECMGANCIQPVDQYVILWKGHPLFITFVGEMVNSNTAKQILSSFKFMLPTVTPRQSSSGSLMRICPEEWIVNHMPSTVGQETDLNEYFVYQGKRRELTEFDVNWVKSNCPIKPEIVQ